VLGGFPRPDPPPPLPRARVPGGVRCAAGRGECDFPELRALGARGEARAGCGARSDAGRASLSSRRGSDAGAASASWATDGTVGLARGGSSPALDAPAASSAPRRAASATHVPPVLEEKSEDSDPDAPLRHVAAAEPPAAGDSAVDSWLARTLAQPGGLASLAAMLRRRPGGAPPCPRRARARPHAAPGAELVASLLEDAGGRRPSGREGPPGEASLETGSQGRSSEVSGPGDPSSGETPWLRGAAPQERRAAKFLIRAFAAAQHVWGLAPPPPPAGRPRPATRAELRAIDREVHQLLMPDLDTELERLRRLPGWYPSLDL